VSEKNGISCSRIHMLAMEEDGVASFVVLLRMGIAAMGMREYEKRHPEVAPLDTHEPTAWPWLWHHCW
jgi:hypothetical protein